MTNINTDNFYEVMVPDINSGEWFYWVECNDEDDAVEAALEKHEQLARPEDFDLGLFPCAYQPIIEDNRAEATIIYES